MAKPKGKRRKKPTRATSGRRSLKRSAKRPTKRSARVRAARASRPRKAKTSRKAPKAPVRRAAKGAAPRRAAKPAATAPQRGASIRKKSPRLDRVRRTLDDTVQTPPSSLNMDRHGSAARTGRAEIEETKQDLGGMSSDIAGGDVDVDVEDAYFTGDGAPGGDNPSPDIDVVDDIGKALGVQYEDNEELKASDKIVERDKHRWEMDPASSEDYKDRK